MAVCAVYPYRSVGYAFAEGMPCDLITGSAEKNEALL